MSKWGPCERVQIDAEWYAPGIMIPRRPMPDRAGRTSRGSWRSVFPGLAAFIGLVWLLLVCLDATDLGPVSAVAHQNLELSIDAGALFYTEIDLATPTPIVGMMADPERDDR